MWPRRRHLYLFSRLERGALWWILPCESIFLTEHVKQRIECQEFNSYSFAIDRMAPMGWSAVSAVTVAMLMAVILWVATAAATPAGQVGIDNPAGWHQGQE